MDIILRREEILNLYKQGMTQVEISKTLNVAQATVNRDLNILEKERGVTIRKKIIKDYKEKIIELYNLDYNYVDIAKELELQQNTVNSYLSSYKRLGYIKDKNKAVKRKLTQAEVDNILYLYFNTPYNYSDIANLASVSVSSVTYHINKFKNNKEAV